MLVYKNVISIKIVKIYNKNRLGGVVMDKEIALIDSNFLKMFQKFSQKQERMPRRRLICQWSMHTMKLEK